MAVLPVGMEQDSSLDMNILKHDSSDKQLSPPSSHELLTGGNE